MKKRAIKYIPLLGLLAGCSNDTAEKPNVIFIMCDDMGY